MTVETLIQRLSQLSPTSEIFIRGYEGGLESVDKLVEKDIIKDFHKKWWNGPHEIIGEHGCENIDSYEVVKGIILSEEE